MGYKCPIESCGFESETVDEFTITCPRCLGYGLPIPGCTCEYQKIPGTEINTGWILHLNAGCPKHQVLPISKEEYGGGWVPKETLE
jgi:hypothetical protein